MYRLIIRNKDHGKLSMDHLPFFTQILLMKKEIVPHELEFLLRFPAVMNVTSPTGVDFLNNLCWGGIKVSWEKHLLSLQTGSLVKQRVLKKIGERNKPSAVSTARSRRGERPRLGSASFFTLYPTREPVRRLHLQPWSSNEKLQSKEEICALDSWILVLLFTV